MADKIDDGGPAFPVANMDVHGTYGMTLRDWFAGHIEASEDMSREWAVAFAGRPYPTPRDGKGAPVEEMAAFWAMAIARYRYAIADAMIAARKAAP